MSITMALPQPAWLWRALARSETCAPSATTDPSPQRPFLQWQGLPKWLFFVDEFSQAPFPPICRLIHFPDRRWSQRATSQTVKRAQTFSLESSKQGERGLFARLDLPIEKRGLSPASSPRGRV